MQAAGRIAVVLGDEAAGIGLVAADRIAEPVSVAATQSVSSDMQLVPNRSPSTKSGRRGSVAADDRGHRMAVDNGSPGRRRRAICASSRRSVRDRAGRCARSAAAPLRQAAARCRCWRVADDARYRAEAAGDPHRAECWRRSAAARRTFSGRVRRVRGSRRGRRAGRRPHHRQAHAPHSSADQLVHEGDPRSARSRRSRESRRGIRPDSSDRNAGS